MIGTRGLAVFAALVFVPALGCGKLGSRAHVLFDDFAYTTTAELATHGWILRSAPGWPGVPGARWGADGFSLHDDPGSPSNRLLRLSAATRGPGGETQQSQLCHERKYLEGTYAARVRFTDDAALGPDGDTIVETFYFISPLEGPMHPDYSEIDFEYLPNGGWGHTGPSLRATTWETFREDPMIDDNITTKSSGSFAGWHTLVAQVAEGRVRYFVDAKPLADHGDRFFPEAPMAIHFNLWFVEDGLRPGADLRRYEQDLDWVFFRRGEVLAPQAVEATVADMRRRKVKFVDTVPPVGLVSPCNL